MRRVLSFIALTCFVAMPLAAVADSGITANAQPSDAELGESIQYTVEASTTGKDRISLIKVPDFGSLKVMSRRQMPTFININGVSQRRLTLVYSLQGTSEGPVTIEPPTFRIGKKTLIPNRVTVQILPLGQRPKPKKNDRSDVFVEAKIEPGREIYVGEQLTLQYNLFVDTRYMDYNPRPPREPEFDDFWMENLNKEMGARKVQNIGGKLMQNTPLRKYALFPLRAGKTEIAALVVDVALGRRRRSQAARVESKSFAIDVKPLPPDAPAGFDEGNVGQWEFKVWTDTSSSRVGQPIMVRLQVNGLGQAHRLELPKFLAPSGARLGEPVVQTTNDSRGSKIRGMKTATYTLMPLEAGELTLPALEFAFFDPEKESYIVRKSKPLVLHIAKGQLPPTPLEPKEMTQRASSGTEDLIGTLLKRLPTPRKMRTEPSLEIAASPFYWLALGLMLLGIVGLVVEAPLRRLRAKGRPLREQKQRRHDLLAALRSAQSPEVVANGIKDYAHEVLAVPRGQITPSRIPSAMKHCGISESGLERLAVILKSADDSRFSAKGSFDSPNAGKEAASILEASPEVGSKASLVALVLMVCLMSSASSAIAADGIEEFKAGEYTQAVASFEAEASDNPDSATAWHNLSLALAHAEQIPKARWAAEKAALLDPLDFPISDTQKVLQRVVQLQAIESQRSGMSLEGDEAIFWWRAATAIPANWIALATFLSVLMLLIVLGLGKRAQGGFWADSATTSWIVALSLTLLSAGVWAAKVQVESSVHPVVLIADAPDFREGPSRHAKKRKRLKGALPGVMLRRVESRSGWSKVVIGDDQSIWVADQDVAALD